MLATPPSQDFSFDVSQSKSKTSLFLTCIKAMSHIDALQAVSSESLKGLRGLNAATIMKLSDSPFLKYHLHLLIFDLRLGLGFWFLHKFFWYCRDCTCTRSAVAMDIFVCHILYWHFHIYFRTRGTVTMCINKKSCSYGTLRYWNTELERLASI